MEWRTSRLASLIWGSVLLLLFFAIGVPAAILDESRRSFVNFLRSL